MQTVTKARGRMRITENVTYKLFDKDGNIKPLFEINILGRFILKTARKLKSSFSNKMLDKIALYGLILPGITGKWANKMTVSNLITNAGMAGAASRINGAGAEAAFTYIALGIGATAANVADTTLDSEIVTGGGERANATASRVTTDVTNDTARLVNTFTFTASFAIVESGILNAASTGTLLSRQVFSAVNVVNTDSLQVTWDVDVD